MAKTNKTRYKITEQIGSGDFAKVYSAEDTKLGRKVAIKQLHSHFNDNPEKMARYWSEAQLLLDIEHPNIMTIYDVVKSRGCLVLELMQGSLNQIYEDKPMPVQDVKETLLQAAKGLDCLHQNGIIHGDVKPANLMLSRQGIVKLGDFGLARRVNDDDGSLLKGTTKYMAPELVSEDFGEVGHASDLYSLGFSALELLIGPDFDSLFPDLIAFGRDKQMAWMMWHCSADREFPPLQSVLEGVPDDLANVLQKLTAKKQANRYRTAEALISDLTEGAKPVGESLRDDELAAAETARLAKRKRRVKAIIACCVSFIACIVIWWLSLPADIAPPITLNPPLRGVIQNVQSHDNKLVVDKGVDFKELDLRKSDVILLNRKQRQLRDLKLGDRIVVKDVRDGDYTKHREFIAFRPESRRGSITAVDLKNGKITASLETDGDPETLDLIVNDETEFSINQSTARRGNALQSLAAEDLISVEISDDESGVLTLQIDAIRLVQLEGFIRKLNPKAGTITLAVISDSNSTDSNASELVTIPIDSNCDFSLNGLLAVNDQVLTVQNIAIGDRVNISHDIAIKRLDAYRSYSEQGRILSLNYDELTLELKLPTATAPKHYRVEKQMAFNLQGQAATFGDLRVGDNIQLKHDSPDTSEPVLNSLEATRPVNKNRWAILIGNQAFESTSLPALPLAIDQLNSIKQQMIDRFAVSENQITVFENANRARIENELPALLSRLDRNDELYVFAVTHGFNDNDRNAYLAARDFNRDDVAQTGIAVDWLIDQIDSTANAKKLLILDCHSIPNIEDSLSSDKMLEIVQGNQRGGFPRSTYVLTNHDSNSVESTAGPLGLIGESFTKALSGEADTEKDLDLKITELTTYIRRDVIDQAKARGVIQTPNLIEPDDRPARISLKAKAAINDLLAKLGKKDWEPGQIMSEAQSASSAASGEPEPMLAGGLLLIRTGKITEALAELEKLRLAHPNSLICHQAVIWIHFYKKHYKLGTSKLLVMLNSIHQPEKEDESFSTDDLNRIEWAGRLRELAVAADWTNRIPEPTVLASIDQTVSAMRPVAGERFEKGRQHTRNVIANFDSQLTDENKSALALQRQRINFYVPNIASPETVREVQQGLDK